MAIWRWRFGDGDLAQAIRRKCSQQQGGRGVATGWTATDETRWHRIWPSHSVPCHGDLGPFTGHKAGYICHRFNKASTILLPLACEHCLVAGGHRTEINRMAKISIQRWKAAGISKLPDLLHMARQEGNLDLRAAILCRLSDRLSHNNPLKLALRGEACR